MTTSVDVFSALVSVALLITTIAPIVLVALFIRDGRNGTLW